MVLVDTSVWIDVLRDGSGTRARRLKEALTDREPALTRFSELELLQGFRDEDDWTRMKEYLESQDYLELAATSWREAARMYFELRRRGRTVRSPVDCCIAQVAIDHDVMLLHRDHDFETIARIRPLRQKYLRW